MGSIFNRVSRKSNVSGSTPASMTTLPHFTLDKVYMNIMIYPFKKHSNIGLRKGSLGATVRLSPYDQKVTGLNRGINN